MQEGGLTIYKGESFALALECLKLDETPVDLTGCTIRSHIRATPKGPLVCDLAPTITDAEAGKVAIHLSPQRTHALAAGEYVWDVLAQYPNGEVVHIVPTEPITVEGRATKFNQPL